MATKYIYKRDASRLFIALSSNHKKYKIYLPQDSFPIVNDDVKEITLIEKKNDSFCFEWNNQRFFAEIKSKEQNKYSIIVNGVEYFFSIESISSYLRRRMLEKANETIQNYTITAPIPGKITEIFVNEGDLINEGEPLFSLEAMKMQNEFNCPFTALVKKIYVKTGDVIIKDQAILELSNINE